MTDPASPLTSVKLFLLMQGMRPEMQVNGHTFEKDATINMSRGYNKFMSVRNASIAFILSMIFTVMLINVKNAMNISTSADKNSICTGIYEMVFFLLISLIAWTFVFAIVTVTQIIFIKDKDKTLMSYLLMKNSMHISHIVVFFILSLLLYFAEEMHFSKPLKQYEGVQSGYSKFYLKATKFFLQYYALLMLLISIFLIMNLLKTLTIDVFSYKLYITEWNAYVEDNADKLRIVKSISKIPGKKTQKDLKKWCDHIFDDLSKPYSVIKRSSVARHLSPDDTDLFMKTFDETTDHTITKASFTNIYTSLLSEQDRMHCSMEQRIQLIENIRLLMNLLLVLIFALTLCWVYKETSNFTWMFSAIQTMLLIVTLAFSKLIRDFFNSLVYVTLVRPFDVGDIIELQGKKYIVSNIGIFYSTMLSDSLMYKIQNMELINQEIINYRISKEHEVSLEYRFHAKEFFAAKERLIEEVISKLQGNNGMKFLWFNMCNLELLQKDRIKVRFMLKTKAMYENINIAYRNTFILQKILHDMFEQYNIKFEKC